ncbi:MAG TPA: hypothetical protein V6C58_19895, partial [Allocoleopsis sp.]
MPLLNIKQSLNKSFLKLPINRGDFDKFQCNLSQLFDKINPDESEEFLKNLIADFLKNTYYHPDYFINTKGRNDLVIHHGKNSKSSVGVILETKKITNKTEMLKVDNLNTKALQELVFYFLKERIINNNLEIKHLIATNLYEWFIFDGQVFDKLFAQNKDFIKQFKEFTEGRLSGKNTDFFYQEIAKPFIAKIENEITFTYFDLRENTLTPNPSPFGRGENTLTPDPSPNGRGEKQRMFLPPSPVVQGSWGSEGHLISLFKIFSPEHLLKLPFGNDSNSLDKNFYNELLYIIGLTETKQGGKKLIERLQSDKRNKASLLENTITQITTLDKIYRLENIEQFGETEGEILFNISLELVITWINRILFLKLLEAQLITYNRNNKDYSFINLDKIKNYDDLNSLFFEVLACESQDRNQDVKSLFSHVPYLNSSLFEPTDLEHETLFISNLKEHKLPIFSGTVLKD